MGGKWKGAMKLHGASKHRVIADDPEIFRGYDYNDGGPYLSGVHNLERDLTINGATVSPTLWYKGEDGNVGAGTWASECGGADGILSEAGAGASPSYAQDTPLLGTDEGVRYNAGIRMEAPGNAFANVTTEDMVIECVFRQNSVNGCIAAKRTVVGVRGWLIGVDTTGIVRVYIWDATGSVTITAGTVTLAAWYHVLFFLDRSGSGIGYLNAIAGSAAVISARAGSLTTAAVPFTVSGYNDSAAGKGDVHIAQLAMWQRDAWLDTHLQATLAAQRFRALTGGRPQVSNVGVDTAPLSYTRATNATLQKYDASAAANKFFTVGSGWLRAERWADNDGALVDGYRAEPASTNKIPYSTVTEATWTKADAGDTTSAEDGPWGTGTAEGWVADATDGDHSRRIACTTTAAAHVFWARLKADAVNWAALHDPVSNVGRYFDLANGALGGVYGGAPTDSYMVSDGDGWWIVAIVWTATAAARNLTIYPAEADGDAAFAGDGVTPSILFAHAQCELGTIDTSAIKTSGGVGTRNKDDLVYSTVKSGAAGALVHDYICREATPATGFIGVDVNDAGATNRLYTNMRTTSRMRGVVRDGLVDGLTDTVNNVPHRVGLTWQTAGVYLWIDGAAQGSDLTFTLPADMTRISLAQAFNATFQPDIPTLIRRIRVWDTYRTDIAKLTQL